MSKENSNSDMKIYVKTMTGKTLYIEISKTDKVDSLRHKI